MKYPPSLQPTDVETLDLPIHGQVRLAKATPQFKLWTGSTEGIDTYGGKQLLDFRGEPVFAELMTLRCLEQDGWKGVWVDTYRRRNWSGMGVEAEPEKATQDLLDRVYLEAGSNSGCFDVVAKKGDDHIFCELKRSKRDAIRESQIRWADAALSVGVPLSSLLVVEWTPA